MNEPKPTHVEEIRDLSRTSKHGRHMVFVKCFAVGGHPASRYEVSLYGAGQTGVVDVPTCSRERLEGQIEQAVQAFVGRLALLSPWQ